MFVDGSYRDHGWVGGWVEGLRECFGAVVAGSGKYENVLVCDPIKVLVEASGITILATQG